MNLNEIFNAQSVTENGDKCYNTTGNKLLDILFMTEYFQNHLDELTIGSSEKEKLFAMFMRDPRYGLGKRDIGRKLMFMANASFAEMAMAGRYDDILLSISEDTADDTNFKNACDFLRREIENGNELAKKWMPRYSSKNLMLARKIAKYWGMNKQQYGHFIKCDTTVEQKLSRKDTDTIKYEQVPSLALLKYFKRFKTGEDTKIEFGKYLESVKSGNAKVNVATTNVYDIYRNQEKIDADMIFDKIEKISGSWIPVVDTSGSMMDANDSFGKACAVGHYLAKCSTYAPNQAISFSSYPQLITLGVMPKVSHRSYWGEFGLPNLGDSQYSREIASLHTGDCSNTDFGAVMNLLKDLDVNNAPEFIVVLSDMEFDRGSTKSKEATMNMFKKNGFNAKIIWWNFNSRNKTSCETDSYGNIFLSGYNPTLLKFLEVGFDGEAFLDKLLDEYKKKISRI